MPTDLGVTWVQLEDDSSYHITQGREFGYPECCIQAFVRDFAEGRGSALRRGTVPDGSGGVYVPCEACCDLMGRVFVQ